MHTHPGMTIATWGNAEAKPFEHAKAQWGDPLAYEQCLLYLQQSMRHGGWVVRNDCGWLGVARDYLAEGAHAGVVPLGVDLVDFIPRALQTLSGAGIAVQRLKHLPCDIAFRLNGQWGLVVHEHPSIEVGSPMEVFSEDRMPQVLLRVQESAWMPESGSCGVFVERLPSGSQMQNLRYQVRRFCRRSLVPGGRVRRQDLRESKRAEIQDGLARWFESLQQRVSGRPGPRVDDMAKCFLDPVVAVIEMARCGAEAHGELVVLNDVPVAVWVGADVSSACYGVYVLVADTRVKHLSDFVVYLTMCWARDRGSTWMNIGGSELSSLFHFKRKSKSASNDTICERRVIEMDVSCLR